MTAVDRKEDAADVVTRLYVEGEYSDNGYVGIEPVNPTGCRFCSTLITTGSWACSPKNMKRLRRNTCSDITAAKADISEKTGALIAAG